MFRVGSLLSLALLLGSAAACGGSSSSSSSSSSGGSGASPGTTVPTGDAAVVKQAVVASASVFELGEQTKTLAAKAVFEASMQSGGTEVVATGTLTQQGTSESFVYAPEPSDRLVVVFTDGTRNELWVTDMRGDFTGKAEDYLGRDHAFQYRIVQSGGKGEIDLEIGDGQLSGGTEATLKGTFEIEGVTYTADVVRKGTKTSSVEIQFAEYTTEEALTGTGSGGDSLAITLSESYRYRSMYSSGRFLQSTTRTVRDTWTQGGASYTADAVVVKHLEDFRAIEIDTGTGWKAEGSITKDGANIGELGLEVGAGLVSIYVLVGGQKTILETTAIAQ